MKNSVKYVYENYVNALISAGYTPTQSERYYIRQFVTRGYTNGWFSYLKRIWLMMGAAANPCAIDLINGSVGVFVGSPTFSSNGVQFAANKYFKTGYIPSSDAANNFQMGWHRRVGSASTTGISMGAANTLQAFVDPCFLANPRVVYTSQAYSTGYLNAKALYCAKTNDGGNLTLFVDLVDPQTSTTVTNTTLLNIGEVYFNGLNLSNAPSSTMDEFTDMVFISSNMPDATYQKFVLDFYNFNTGIGRQAAIAATNVIRYEGNSFMVGTGLAQSLNSVINTYLTGVGLTFNTSSGAVSGSTITSVVGGTNYLEYSARLSADYSAISMHSPENVFCANEGLNELSKQLTLNPISTSVVNTYNAYVSMYSYTTGLARLGYRCVFNTVSPCNPATVGNNFETARQNASNKLDTSTLNGLLRTDFDQPTSLTRVFTSSLPKWNNCVLVDYGDDPNFGQAGQWADATYYQADGVHPTNLMQSQLANNYFGPVIQRLTNNSL